VLREDGSLIPTTQFLPRRGNFENNAAAKSKDYVRRHWRYRDPASRPGDLLGRAQSHALSISGMAFQDAWNIDLERLRRCCVHVVTLDKKLVPFCAYYVTSSTGRRLYGMRQLAAAFP
jgi:hypothetical protein